MNPDYGYSIARRARGGTRVTPDIGIEPPEWTLAAVCASVDPELFYPEKGCDVRPAKRVCASCPVKDPCLQYALDHNERFGVWGGLSERERRRVRPGYRGAAA